MLNYNPPGFLLSLNNTDACRSRPPSGEMSHECHVGSLTLISVRPRSPLVH